MGEAKRRVSKRRKDAPALYRKADVTRILPPDLEGAEFRSACALHALARIAEARKDGALDDDPPEARPQYYLRQGLWTATDRLFKPIATAASFDDLMAAIAVDAPVGHSELPIVDGFPAILTSASSDHRQVWQCPDELILVHDDGQEVDDPVKFMAGKVRTCPDTGQSTCADLDVCAQVTAGALAGVDSCHFAHACVLANTATDPLGPYRQQFAAAPERHADAVSARRMAASLIALRDPGADDVADAAEQAEETFVEMQEGAWRSRRLLSFLEFTTGVSPLQVRTFDRHAHKDRADQQMERSVVKMSAAFEERISMRPFAIPDRVGRITLANSEWGEADLGPLTTRMRDDWDVYDFQQDIHLDETDSDGRIVFGHGSYAGLHCAFRLTANSLLAYFWEE